MEVVLFLSSFFIHSTALELMCDSEYNICRHRIISQVQPCTPPTLCTFPNSVQKVESSDHSGLIESCVVSYSSLSACDALGLVQPLQVLESSFCVA